LGKTLPINGRSTTSDPQLNPRLGNNVSQRGWRGLKIENRDGDYLVSGSTIFLNQP
jgi:hypothetical protein